MLNMDQQYLLTQMGIITWQPTIDLPGAKRALKYACYRLNQPNVRLIVEHGEQLDADESTLLNNMLRSVCLEIIGQINIDDPQEANIILIMPIADDFIAKIGHMDSGAIHVTHPKALLNGAAKREAWHSMIRAVPLKMFKLSKSGFSEEK